MLVVGVLANDHEHVAEARNAPGAAARSRDLGQAPESEGGDGCREDDANAHAA